MRRFIMLGLMLLIPFGPAFAEAPVKKLFTCAIGKKTVSVTIAGDQLIYHFGTAGKDEIAIIGTPASGNIFQMTQRYAGMEYQLRFKKDEFSYIVYSSEGNPNVGASATSGLVVMQGTKTIMDKPCSKLTELTLPDATLKVPEDSEAYSAM
jgi:hypothetical protein